MYVRLYVGIFVLLRVTVPIKGHTLIVQTLTRCYSIPIDPILINNIPKHRETFKELKGTLLIVFRDHLI